MSGRADCSFVLCLPPATKDTGTKDTISQFGRRNQMSSSNILGIHGLKKKPQFQGSNRDIQWWLCPSVIMYVVYSIIRRSSDLTVLDVWTAQPLSLDAL
jgi:hypothetical protein